MTHTGIEVRLDQLERRVASLRALALVLAIALAASWTLAARSPEGEVSMASEYRLVNSAGETGARLGYSEEGFPELSLYDPNGRKRAVLAIEPGWSEDEHRVSLVFRDRAGEDALRLGCSDNEHHGDGPHLTLSSSGEPFLTVGGYTSGSTELQLRSGSGGLLRLGVDAVTRQGFLHLHQDEVDEELAWLPRRPGAVLLLGKGANDEPFGVRLLTPDSSAELTAADEAPRLQLTGPDGETMFDTLATSRETAPK